LPRALARGLKIGKGHGFSQTFQPFLGYLPSVQAGSPIFIGNNIPRALARGN